MKLLLLTAVLAIGFVSAHEGQLGSSCRVGDTCGEGMSCQPAARSSLYRQKRWTCVFCGNVPEDERELPRAEQQTQDPPPVEEEEEEVIPDPVPPTPVEPEEPTPVEPTPVEPTPVEPAPVEPQNVELIDTDVEELEFVPEPQQVNEPTEVEFDENFPVNEPVLIGEEEWNSDLSVEDLAKIYMDQQAERLPSDDVVMDMDDGPDSVEPTVTTEDNVDTEFFDNRLDFFRTVPTSITKNIHTYEVNKRVINNLLNKINRFNLHNHLISEQNEFINNIHHPQEITETNNRVVEQIKPTVFNHIYEVQNREENTEVRPVEASATEANLDSETEKLPVEVFVIREEGQPPADPNAPSARSSPSPSRSSSSSSTGFRSRGFRRFRRHSDSDDVEGTGFICACDSNHVMDSSFQRCIPRN